MEFCQSEKVGTLHCLVRTVLLATMESIHDYKKKSNLSSSPSPSANEPLPFDLEEFVLHVGCFIVDHVTCAQRLTQFDGVCATSGRHLSVPRAQQLQQSASVMSVIF